MLRVLDQGERRDLVSVRTSDAPAHLLICCGRLSNWSPPIPPFWIISLAGIDFETRIYDGPISGMFSIQAPLRDRSRKSASPLLCWKPRRPLETRLPVFRISTGVSRVRTDGQGDFDRRKHASRNAT